MYNINVLQTDMYVLILQIYTNVYGKRKQYHVHGELRLSNSYHGNFKW